MSGICVVRKGLFQSNSHQVHIIPGDNSSELSKTDRFYDKHVSTIIDLFLTYFNFYKITLYL